MNKRGLLYAIFGLVFYLFFLIIGLPASWFAWGLNHFTHGGMQLEPIAGSLWHGTGRLVYYYPPTVPHDLGNAEWHINPLWLFTGRVQMSWQSNAQDTRLDTTIRLGAGNVELLKTEAAFPAQSVGAFYPPAGLISPQGQVRVHINSLTLNREGVTGDGDIQWQDAGSALTTVQPLGDYRLEIVGAGRTANLKLSTLRGALQLTGQGQWQVTTGQIQFNGYAVAQERAPELEPLLTLLGPDQGNGQRRLTLNSQVRLWQN
ncbi:MAG: type II secretion system protein N [Sulfuricaulis sp.]